MRNLFHVLAPVNEPLAYKKKICLVGPHRIETALSEFSNCIFSTSNISMSLSEQTDLPPVLGPVDLAPKYWPLFTRVVPSWASKGAPHATPIPPTFPSGNDRPDARR